MKRKKTFTHVSGQVQELLGEIGRDQHGTKRVRVVGSTITDQLGVKRDKLQMDFTAMILRLKGEVSQIEHAL